MLVLNQQDGRAWGNAAKIDALTEEYGNWAAKVNGWGLLLKEARIQR